MIDNKLQALSKSAHSYFDFLFDGDFEIDQPRVDKNQKQQSSEYLATIVFSGEINGKYCFSASEETLRTLLKQYGIEDTDNEQLLADISGEVANSILGNAKDYFEFEYEISTPSISKNKRLESVFEKDEVVYVIPIKLNGSKASVSITMQ